MLSSDMPKLSRIMFVNIVLVSIKYAIFSPTRHSIRIFFSVLRSTFSTYENVVNCDLMLDYFIVVDKVGSPSRGLVH